MSENSKGSRAGRRVLVVDDNKDVLAGLSTLMQISGFDVRTARDGVEGFETAEEFRPEVVLMDLGMPRMDGYEAARYMRRQPWGGSIHLIAISGLGQAQHRQQSKEAGFDAHLVKPIRLADILAVMSSGK